MLKGRPLLELPNNAVYKFITTVSLCIFIAFDILNNKVCLKINIINLKKRFFERIIFDWV